jgi:hypothetical protein
MDRSGTLEIVEVDFGGAVSAQFLGDRCGERDGAGAPDG